MFSFVPLPSSRGSDKWLCPAGDAPRRASEPAQLPVTRLSPQLVSELARQDLAPLDAITGGYSSKASRFDPFHGEST